jgi:hypothetical protein
MSKSWKKNVPPDEEFFFFEILHIGYQKQEFMLNSTIWTCLSDKILWKRLKKKVLKQIWLSYIFFRLSFLKEHFVTKACLQFLNQYKILLFWHPKLSIPRKKYLLERAFSQISDIKASLLEKWLTL